MNLLVSETFGLYYARLPLRKSATIVHGNALRIDWQQLLNPVNAIDVFANHANIYLVEEPSVPYNVVNVKAKSFEVHKGKLPEPSTNVKFDYILGNPPFVGTAYQSKEQKDDMQLIFKGVKSAGMLDYVSAWYFLAAKYIQGTSVKAAFVSTNSIIQGEQVGILWSELFNVYNIKIHFAHQTFKWNNEARGKAAVHVVIVGFANYDSTDKTIYEYQDIFQDPNERKVRNINPYLVQGEDNSLASISMPISSVPKMQSGSAARDGGFLILSDDEKISFEERNPNTSIFFSRFISGDDFINNKVRWCIWLKNINPSDFRNNAELLNRFKSVKKFREESTRAGTKKMAAYPYLFAEERQPEKDFLVIPKVSSENRRYIPIAYLTKDFIVSDKTFVVPNATMYHFGIITSTMHMAWMRTTCGRLKSDYSYSNTIVYNNYPWPKAPSEKQKQAVEDKVQKVLDARSQFPNSSLAELYDPLTMPPALVKAHQELDKAVDQCYRPQPFATETARMEYLFELYNEYTQPLLQTERKKKKK